MPAIARVSIFNYPLPDGITAADYRRELDLTLRRIQRFRPAYLVVSLGLDTARAAPTGTRPLSVRDFIVNRRMIGALRLPTLVLREGSYRTCTLGINARRFFKGLVSANPATDETSTRR